jgi:protein tyrosine kinase modulator
VRGHERAAPLKPEQVLQYLELPLRRPWYVLIPLVLAVAGALAVSYVVPPRYESSTLVMVEAQKIPDSFLEKTTVEKPKRLLTVRQEVLSRTRLERILQELDPYPQAAADQAPITALVERMREATDITVKGDDAFVIGYTHRDPRKAMEVAGRLASLFIEETTRTSERDVTEATRFIESQLT